MKPAADLEAVSELPDPLLFSDGSRVDTAEDWPRRPAELAELPQAYQYGHLPAPPERLHVTRGDVTVDEHIGATIESLTAEMAHGNQTFALSIRLVSPQGAAGPTPVVIQASFGRRRRRNADEPEPASPNERLRIYMERGYAVAEFSPRDVAADDKDNARETGIYALLGRDIDCGALMAWAWGFHRVADVLETVDSIDATKVVVTGHSRYGKAALVAGAFDERIAVTVPSHSGCGGAAPYHFIYGNSEQLHNIVGFAPHWFRPNFNQFVDNVERLPFDQHELRALVAPRAQLSTEGTEDSWTNPEGSQLTFLAARKVYELLGAGDRLSIRYRPVGHIPSSKDLLDFADHVFAGAPLPKAFGALAYDEAGAAMPWAGAE